jgi:RNA polymerase-interacting CarD/CdnL/TRCF family regulator
MLAARGGYKGGVMNPQSEAFQVGEQVTLIQPYMGLGVGSVGAITRIHHTYPPCYRVRFAHIDVTVLVPTEYLARVRMYGSM